MNDFANAEHNRLLKANSGNAGYALMDACEQIAALTSQVDALTAEIAAMKEAQRWIPVEERLPEPGVPVLMWLHPRHIPGQAKEGTYMPVLNPDRPWRSTWDMSTYETGEITHWRPMPFAPSEEET